MTINRKYRIAFFLLLVTCALGLLTFGLNHVYTHPKIDNPPPLQITTPHPVDTSTLSQEVYVEHPTTIQTSGGISLILKKNVLDKTHTDIYLKDPQTDQSTLFMTIPDVTIGSSRVADYHDNTLYIQRAGKDAGLWKYDEKKQGTKLYTGLYFSFLMSPDAGSIAIIELSSCEESSSCSITFIKNDGMFIQKLKLKPKKNDHSYVDFITWSKDALWVNGGDGPETLFLIKINTRNFQYSEFDLRAIGPTDFSLNPTKQQIAFCDYPTFFDIFDDNEFKKTKRIVTLFIYDLLTKKKTAIETSIATDFDPIWIDDKTLEYNDSADHGRTRKTFP